MHGFIFSELKKYVDTKLGKQVWPALLTQAGLGQRSYLPGQAYPDAEVVALVTTAAQMTAQPAGKILEDFGAFITPDLLKLYGALIDSRWKTLDVIEHTEATIHRVVRIKDPVAKPPELKVTRPSPDEVVIDYRSQRKLCGVAKGIAQGLARHYQERVTITESSCMLNGAARCLISVRLG